MKFETWEKIARRHVHYRDLLQERMGRIDEASIGSCTDISILKGYVRLADRVERHQHRMARHNTKSLIALPVTTTSVN